MRPAERSKGFYAAVVVASAAFGERKLGCKTAQKGGLRGVKAVIDRFHTVKPRACAPTRNLLGTLGQNPVQRVSEDSTASPFMYPCNGREKIGQLDLGALWPLFGKEARECLAPVGYRADAHKLRRKMGAVDRLPGRGHQSCGIDRIARGA